MLHILSFFNESRYKMENREIIEKYMKIAIDEAIKSKENGENPFGAVLLDSNYNFAINQEQDVLNYQILLLMQKHLL